MSAISFHFIVLRGRDKRNEETFLMHPKTGQKFGYQRFCEADANGTIGS
jgi:hypothetical protein